MKKLLKSLIAALLCLVMVFAFVACTQTPGVDTTEIKGTDGKVLYKGTVKIGAAIARSGLYAGVGGPYGGFYDLYVKYINEVEGGVAKGDDGIGFKLEAKTYDDGGDGTKGLSFIQQLIEDDGVFALVGNLGTWNIEAAQDYIVESGVPSVYWGTGASKQYYNPAKGNERYTFPVQPIYTTEGRIMYLRALQLGVRENFEVKKIGVLYSSTDDGTSGLAGIEEQAGLDKGTSKPTIVKALVSGTTVDAVSSQVDQMEGCDIVIMACNQAYFKACYSSMQQKPGLKGKPVITSYVNIAPTNVPDEAVENGASDIYGGSWVIIDDSASDRQKADLTEFLTICQWGVENAGLSQDEANAYALSAYAMSSYIALKVFKAGMDRLSDKTITRKAFLEAMESGRIDVPISGGVDYSDGVRIGLDGMGFVKYQKPAQGTAQQGTFVNLIPMQSIDDILGQLGG